MVDQTANSIITATWQNVGYAFRRKNMPNSKLKTLSEKFKLLTEKPQQPNRQHRIATEKAEIVSDCLSPVLFFLCLANINFCAYRSTFAQN